MPDLQRYPWNLNLIKTWKITFIFVNFFIKHEMRELLAQKTTHENKPVKETKHRYLIYALSDKDFTGSV